MLMCDEKDDAKGADFLVAVVVRGGEGCAFVDGRVPFSV